MSRARLICLWRCKVRMPLLKTFEARAPLRLPDFIGIGPPRTGTTWLYEVLKGHVGLPQRIKEIQFFKWHYEQGLPWYASHFRNCPPGLPVGEICPVYFNFAQARERIASDLPECKIVCSVRDPVERLYSHYRMLRAYSGLRSFEESLETVPDLIESSRYVSHIRAWRKSFGTDRVLILVYDDLAADPQRFVDLVSKFIRIPRTNITLAALRDKRINRADRAPRSLRLANVANR